MSAPRFAKKLDATHTEIANYLRGAGCEVIDCSRAGKVPDLLVKHQSKVGWAECKVTDKGKILFTWAQLNWIANTTYAVRIVDNKEDALLFAKTHEGAISQLAKDRLAVFCASVTDKKKLYTVNQVTEVMK